MIIDPNIIKMINQDCPQCKRTAGDIISYMPIITDNKLEIEIECESCGCYAKFTCSIESTLFKPSI